MRRVLMLLYNPVGRGTYWRALGLGRALTRWGYQVTLMAVSPGRRWGFDRRTVEGVTVVETPNLGIGPLRLDGYDPYDTVARLVWLRHQGVFDLVHAFECRPVVAGPALFLRRLRGVPLIYDWADWFGRGGSVEERPNPWLRGPLRPIETFLEERVRRWADGMTVINSWLYERVRAWGFPAERLCLLPNGADVERIRPGDRRAARRRLGLPSEADLIVYVGALFRRDAELMAAAFDHIYSRRPRARLLLVGYGRVPVERMVAVPTAVWRTGPVREDQLADYLVASDVAWLPLRDTGANRGRFPLKLHDFLAAGLPTVVTDVGDVGAFVRQTGAGRVVPDRPEDLAEAVLELLDDEAARHALGRRARQVAEAWAWPRVAETLVEFYEHLLGMRGPG